jgi:hypothetical protein
MYSRSRSSARLLGVGAPKNAVVGGVQVGDHGRVFSAERFQSRWSQAERDRPKSVGHSALVLSARNLGDGKFRTGSNRQQLLRLAIGAA